MKPSDAIPGEFYYNTKHHYVYCLIRVDLWRPVEWYALIEMDGTRLDYVSDEAAAQPHSMWYHLVPAKDWQIRARIENVLGGRNPNARLDKPLRSATVPASTRQFAKHD